MLQMSKQTIDLMLRWSIILLMVIAYDLPSFLIVFPFFRYLITDHKSVKSGKQCYLVFSSDENDLLKTYLSEYRKLLALGKAEREQDPVFPVSLHMAVGKMDCKGPRLRLSYSGINKIMARTFKIPCPESKKVFSSHIARYSARTNVSIMGITREESENVSAAMAHTPGTAQCYYDQATQLPRIIEGVKVIASTAKEESPSQEGPTGGSEDPTFDDPPPQGLSDLFVSIFCLTLKYCYLHLCLNFYYEIIFRLNLLNNFPSGN